jgi:Tfp pilus assembly protein PilF
VALLAGCAAHAPVEPEPAAEQPAAEKGPLVTRLADGRQGFIIAETAHMDDPSRAAFQQAVALLEDEDYSAAIELLEQVIEQSPGVTAPYINLAMAYGRSDQPDLAEAHLKTALQLFPGHPVASNQYGLLCRRSGRFAEARAVYEQALAVFPEYYPVHRNLGILCDLYLNDTACALEHYEIYSQAMLEDQQVKMWIADLRLRLGSN